MMNEFGIEELEANEEMMSNDDFFLSSSAIGVAIILTSGN